jgi:hypothetical protein
MATEFAGAIAEQREETESLRGVLASIKNKLIQMPATPTRSPKSRVDESDSETKVKTPPKRKKNPNKRSRRQRRRRRSSNRKEGGSTSNSAHDNHIEMEGRRRVQTWDGMRRRAREPQAGSHSGAPGIYEVRHNRSKGIQN